MKNGEEPGIISVLSSILKKSTELPEEITCLPKSVETIAIEVTKLSQSITKVAKLVMQHHEAIEQILAAQAIILSTIVKNQTEIKLPDSSKNKPGKPN